MISSAAIGYCCQRRRLVLKSYRDPGNTRLIRVLNAVLVQIIPYIVS
ncbi:MAG: hypothetical protein A4E49_01679 [Methanosaeta sp. PtaU1.Bin112]|nr:MAG: hypothetical protein A4E49_01679 [Methanosaeta sp. PtaU1.Bin112]